MTRGMLHTYTQLDHFWSFYATFHDMIEIIEIPILSQFLSILLYHEMRYLSRGNIGYKLTIFTRYHNKASTAENPKKTGRIENALGILRRKNGSTIENVEVMPDHVHLVLSFHLSLYRRALSKASKAQLPVSSSNFIQKTSKTLQRASLKSSLLHADSRNRF